MIGRGEKFGRSQSFSCSFCGKTQDEVRKLVAGPSVYICDECVELCNDILVEELDAGLGTPSQTSDLTPFQIKEYLDQFIIGQDQAKRILSVAVHNHYKRIEHLSGPDSGVEVQKANVLLIGPTGTGKTLLAQTLAKILNVPFTIADATNLTEAGYVGEDVENIILNLLQAADYDIERAERGIIYIDEIDKISRKSESPSVTRDVSGEGVQQALLRLIEGTKASVPPKGGRKHPHQDLLEIDTSNILFICGGAFAGIDGIIGKRLGNSQIGFGGNIVKLKDKQASSLKNIDPKDLLTYGLIPEFVGRLPVVATLDDLDQADLIRVLTEPKNALVRQYQRLLEFNEVNLRFTDGAVAAIAEKAKARKTGARGLRSIIEEALLDTMFEVPSRRDVSEVVVSETVITQGERPLYVYENDAVFESDTAQNE